MLEDGGDVQFDRFEQETGVLYLRMIGAELTEGLHWKLSRGVWFRKKKLFLVD